MNASLQPKPDAKRLPSGAEMIAANAYPAVMPKSEASRFIANLKSEETGKRAEETIAASRNVMRDAVEAYVRALDEASRKHDVNSSPFRAARSGFSRRWCRSRQSGLRFCPRRVPTFTGSCRALRRVWRVRREGLGRSWTCGWRRVARHIA